jgi:ABC-type spermidine/putrescine transport system permease subunit II/sugar lactone lactonase YvrE
LGGTVWILTLLTWPIAFLAASSAWQRLEAPQLESDPALTGLPLIRWLLWPMARPSVGLAAVLTFVLAFNNFAVPAILQVKVFPAEVWVKFNTNFAYKEALSLSWPLILMPLLLLFCLKSAKISWPRQEGEAGSRAIRRQLGLAWWLSGLAMVLVLCLSVGLPMIQLLTVEQTWTELPKVFRAAPGLIGNSLVLAAVAASLCMAAGVVSWRLRAGLVLWLPFLMPGVLLGIAMIFLFNRPVLEVLYHSLGMVVLAWIIRYAVVSWKSAGLAFQGMDESLAEAARLDGASGWSLFRNAHWPQIAPQLAAAWYLTYLLCLWDVETLILVVPPGGETLALRIFNLLHYGHNAQVNALCLWLLVLAAAPLLARSGGRWLQGRFNKSMLWLALAGMALAGCEQNRDLPLQSKFFSRVQIIGSRGTGPGELNKPRSVALDTNDNLYVVDMTGRVQQFSPDGLFLSSWQMPQTDKGKPKGMCRDQDGNVVVLEPHYSRVNHFTPKGKLVAQWGTHGTNTGELAFPRSVAVNSKGEIFVSEYGLTERVQCFSGQGQKWLRVIVGEGRDGFNRAEGLGVDAADRLYVADSCNHRVQVFSPEGKRLRSYGRPGTALGDLSYPYDVRVDPAGYQYVCEFGNSRVQIFDVRDQPVEIVGGVGSAPGRFSNPWSIALDSHGNLYVADAGNHRVQKFVRKSK